MFYRVVMQGRTLGGADIDEVKRKFVRVTGLPARVAEQMFGGMPQVIKRQVPQSDAERIAATLRAIGAAATVERELRGEEEETQEEIRIIANPLNAGPPTVIPGMEPPPQKAASSRHVRWLRAASDKWPVLAGGAALIAGAILLAPFADDLISSVRRAPPPAPAAAKRAPPPEASESSLPVFNAMLLHGPWRCTDQRTGVSTYYDYGADGALTYYGEVLKEGTASRDAATHVPTGWRLEGSRLLLTFTQRAPDTYAMADLTLTRLRYGNERGLDIQCRRP